MLLVLAGAADRVGTSPQDGTPLADAETPGLDQMARLGRAGTFVLEASTPWNGFMALLGLDGDVAALGPIEALGAGVVVPPGSAAWRADFVTMDDAGLSDPTAGKVNEPAATALLDVARAALPGVALHRLEGHRNLAVADGPPEFASSPWEMIGRRAVSGLDARGRIPAWFDAARRVLEAHDVNHVRVDLLQNPANALWFHGGGVAVAGGLRSALAGQDAVLVGRGRVTAGLATALGWRACVVDGDDEALAAEALTAIATADLVVVRTETPLWAAAASGTAGRRDAISVADARLVRPILGALEECDAYAFAVASDCVLASDTRALLQRPSPIVVVTSDNAPPHDGAPVRFSEYVCERSGFHVQGGQGLAALLAP